jgi:hypothetical protein
VGGNFLGCSFIKGIYIFENSKKKEAADIVQDSSCFQQDFLDAARILVMHDKLYLQLHLPSRIFY